LLHYTHVCRSFVDSRAFAYGLRTVRARTFYATLRARCYGCRFHTYTALLRCRCVRSLRFVPGYVYRSFRLRLVWLHVLLVYIYARVYRFAFGCCYVYTRLRVTFTLRWFRAFVVHRLRCVWFVTLRWFVHAFAAAFLLRARCATTRDFDSTLRFPPRLVRSRWFSVTRLRFARALHFTPHAHWLRVSFTVLIYQFYARCAGSRLRFYSFSRSLRLRTPLRLRVLRTGCVHAIWFAVGCAPFALCAACTLLLTLPLCVYHFRRTAAPPRLMRLRLRYARTAQFTLLVYVHYAHRSRITDYGCALGCRTARFGLLFAVPRIYAVDSTHFIALRARLPRWVAVALLLVYFAGFACVLARFPVAFFTRTIGCARCHAWFAHVYARTRVALRGGYVLVAVTHSRCAHVRTARCRCRYAFIHARSLHNSRMFSCCTFARACSTLVSRLPRLVYVLGFCGSRGV